MNTSARPIKPALHAIADYGLVAAFFAAPALLNFPDSARWVAYAFGAMELLFIAFSDHRLAVARLIPMKIHGLLEYPILAVYVLVPLLVGALNDPAARWFFLTVVVIALILHFLTDFNAGAARTAGRPQYEGQRP